ncbi:hypothetical protein O9G_004900 [Rozella allomycis CSF55]|uniref:Uncharacterized protein n=1 Tax=Rozella allomycis (strain CSF55) TaxID=988480 RepID=A0A075B0B1_ROZAC|nr:hypothetical protein O9G_004900 [Rozella allomycis CSF55]|eukprot:EPZ35815.1 hypothetical protein O9G_004900 [Rozella allomycis CSF55]
MADEYTPQDCRRAYAMYLYCKNFRSTQQHAFESSTWESEVDKILYALDVEKQDILNAKKEELKNNRVFKNEK